MAANPRAGTLRLEVLSLQPETSSTTSPPHCELCGEVIGVYERLVEVLAGVAHETSRAAEPALSHNPRGAYYHASCLKGTDAVP